MFAQASIKSRLIDNNFKAINLISVVYILVFLGEMRRHRSELTMGGQTKAERPVVVKMYDHHNLY